MRDHHDLNGRVQRKLLFVLILIFLSSTRVIASDDWIYTVSAGENLWVLADRYLKNVSFTERLKTYNQIVDPYKIPLGTKIKAPSSGLKRLLFS